MLFLGTQTIPASQSHSQHHMPTWRCAVPRDTNHSSITISLPASHAHRWCAVSRDTNHSSITISLPASHAHRWCAVPRDTNRSSITISLLASHAHRWCAVPRDTNITTPRHTTALLKVGSTILAQAAGVPTLPWSGSGVAISFAECNGDIPPELYAKVRAWVGKRLNTST